VPGAALCATGIRDAKTSRVRFGCDNIYFFGFFFGKFSGGRTVDRINICKVGFGFVNLAASTRLQRKPKT